MGKPELHRSRTLLGLMCLGRPGDGNDRLAVSVYQPAKRDLSGSGIVLGGELFQGLN